MILRRLSRGTLGEAGGFLEEVDKAGAEGWHACGYKCSCGFQCRPEGGWDVVPCRIGSESKGLQTVEAYHGQDTYTDEELEVSTKALQN